MPLSKGKAPASLVPSEPGDPSPYEHTLEKHRDTESQYWVI